MIQKDILPFPYTELTIALLFMLFNLTPLFDLSGHIPRQQLPKCNYTIKDWKVQSMNMWPTHYLPQ